ncbi:unannotated protein [freshwater metagenome]|uniref:Unannotated protein n=1 Tax=freshwater metagenome TaxID=449393 RepID=A0A6J7VYG5_9ZZZZ
MIAAPIANPIATGTNIIPASGSRNGKWWPASREASTRLPATNTDARIDHTKREFFATNAATNNGTYKNRTRPPRTAGPVSMRIRSHQPRPLGRLVSTPTITAHASGCKKRVVQGRFSTTAATVAVRAPANPKPAARVDPPPRTAASCHNTAHITTTRTVEGLKAKVTASSRESFATN